MWLRSHRVEVVAALGLGVLLGWQLLTPPVIGLANNGDFYRIAPQSGVYYLNPSGPETEDPNGPGYISRLYRTGAPKNPQGYYSSGVPLMWLARGLNDLARRDGLFDVRVLGAVHLAALLVAVVLFLSALPRRPAAARWLATALTCLVLGDVGYFSFLSSFYSESASLIYLLLTAAAVLRLPGRGAAVGTAMARDAAFLAANALFLTAKPQNAVLAPLLVALWWGARWPAVRGKESRRSMLAVAVAGVLLCAFATLYFAVSPFKQVNRYNHVFHDILGKDPEAAAHLAALGLGDEYVELIGSHWWSPLSDRQQALKESTAGRLTTAGIVRYYRRNPERFAALFSRGAEAAFVFRPEGLGNFERARGGPPGELSERFDHWAGVKHALYPRAAWSLICAGVVLGVLWGLLLRFGGGDRRPAALGLALWGMMALQFFAVLVGGGEVELVRHLFLFNALADLSLIVLVAGVGALCQPEAS
ncbi:MAG: hypothetical protein GY719_28425 [bacterium]|nr:hypothetical protein [bacterium]